MKKQLGTRHSPIIFNKIDELIQQFKKDGLVLSKAEVIERAILNYHSIKIKK